MAARVRSGPDDRRLATGLAKANVRKLKNLGLTVSHHPGYTLSPRGETMLRHLPREV